MMSACLNSIIQQRTIPAVKPCVLYKKAGATRTVLNNDGSDCQVTLPEATCTAVGDIAGRVTLHARKPCLCICRICDTSTGLLSSDRKSARVQIYHDVACYVVDVRLRAQGQQVIVKQPSENPWVCYQAI
jgi:hypothetical protein